MLRRADQPGDLGWIVQRHGELYAHEHGWDTSFEAHVARTVGDLPPESAGWIAEVDGERAGCVFCVPGKDGTAVVRVLLVEPFARGRGVGEALVRACIDFARDGGHDRLELWTVDVLLGARRIYARQGFTVRERVPHRAFGVELMGETWELPLATR